MYDFGAIILTPFPFTDLTSTKVRPALIISKNLSGQDIIVAFISSNLSLNKYSLLINNRNSFFAKTGLKTASTIRFDKIATLNKAIILGEIGSIPAEFLNKHSRVFANVFGF